MYYIPLHMRTGNVSRRDIDDEIRDARFLVDAGKDFLDDHFHEIADLDPSCEPGWREHLSPESLDLGCTHHCMLGQLFGHFRDAASRIEDYFLYNPGEWDDICDALNVRLSEGVHKSRYYDYTALLGFDYGIVSADALQIGWLEVITDERYRKAPEAAPDQMEMIMPR